MRPSTSRVVSLLLAGWWVVCSAWAVNVRQLPKPQGYVSDFAQVIDAPTKTELEHYCGQVEQSTGVQFAVVTVDTLDGEPIEDAANALFRQWGIGQKAGPNRDEGVLLLLAVKDHQNRLEIGRMAENYLPDGFDGSVLRSMRPSLREAKYGDALQVAVHAVGQRIAQQKNVTIQPGVRHDPPQQPEDHFDIPWPMIVFFIIFLLMVINSRRRGPGGPFSGGGGFFPGVILGNMMGGGSSSVGGGGGGFGGSDSGGGFGGFGGGDSGGGGASSNW